MAKPRAILHIGTAKTGSTSIQRMLAGNRARLQRAGVLVPLSPGERNHFRLAIYAGQERADRMAQATNEAGDAAYVADRFAAEFAAEMRAMPASVHTVLFSNEHCYRKLDSPAAVERLRALLAHWFDSIEVLVYLRRQDEMAVSLYSTRLRSGADRTEVLPNLAALPNQAAKLDWHTLVERWAAVFGRAAMRPRLFLREAFVRGDLLADFAAAAGIDGIAGLEHPELRNTAIVAPAQEFLRRINTALDDGSDDQDEKAPPFVRAFVDTHFAGRGRRPSRAQAEAFMAHFAPSNERLRAAWFPSRSALFDDDFTRYPASADPLPTDTEVLDVAIALVTHQAGERPQLEAETLYRRGLKLRGSGDLVEARLALNKALGKQTGHAGALRLLFEMAATPTLRREAEARLRRARRGEPGREDLARLQAEQGVVFDPAPPLRPVKAPAAADPATLRKQRQQARKAKRRKDRSTAPAAEAPVGAS